MEWLATTLGFNSTLVKEGLANSFGFNSTVIRTGFNSAYEGLHEVGLNVASGILDHIVLPLTNFLLRNAEQAVKYSLNGDYVKYEEVTSQSLYSALSWLQLSPFQIKLIWEFFVIILGNSLLVFVAWRWYGERIRSKFMVEGRRNIEEIRISFSELKLPREMDFKFK